MYVVHKQAQLELHPQANRQSMKLDQSPRRMVPRPISWKRERSRCVLHLLHAVGRVTTAGDRPETNYSRPASM